MWLLSLLALPSTPRPTGVPASRMARTGAMPLARRMLLLGQWATPVWVRAKSATSWPFRWTQWACQTSSPTQWSSSA